MNASERIKGFLLSLLSRKFLLAVAFSIIAFDKAGIDGTVTVEEILVALSPIFGFLGVEGYSDAIARSNKEY